MGCVSEDSARPSTTTRNHGTVCGEKQLQRAFGDCRASKKASGGCEAERAAYAERSCRIGGEAQGTGY